jgi:hypothetical protein
MVRPLTPRRPTRAGKPVTFLVFLAANTTQCPSAAKVKVLLTFSFSTALSMLAQQRLVENDRDPEKLTLLIIDAAATAEFDRLLVAGVSM